MTLDLVVGSLASKVKWFIVCSLSDSANGQPVGKGFIESASLRGSAEVTQSGEVSIGWEIPN